MFSPPSPDRDETAIPPPAALGERMVLVRMTLLVVLAVAIALAEPLLHHPEVYYILRRWQCDGAAIWVESEHRQVTAWLAFVMVALVAPTRSWRVRLWCAVLTALAVACLFM